MTTVTKRNTAPERVRPKGRRGMIADVAAELFAERGFVGTGVGDIAERVGITPGAIYRHFRSKDELLASILQDFLTASSAALAIDADAFADPEQRLRALVAASIDVVLSERSRVAVYLTERRSLAEPTGTRLRAEERRLNDLWQAAITAARPGLSDAETAARLRALNGACLHLTRSKAQQLPRTRLTTLFTDALMALLLAPPRQLSASATPEPHSWSPPRSRRQEIREGAAALFRKHGYHAVGMDDIAQAVDIPATTMYRAYRSKSDILADACEQAVAVVEVFTRQALDRAASADEALLLVLHAYVTVVAGHADIIAVANKETEALAEADRAHIEPHMTDLRDLRAAVLAQVRPDLDITEARILFDAACVAVQEAAMLPPTRRPDVEATADLMARFLLARPTSRTEPADGDALAPAAPLG